MKIQLILIKITKQNNKHITSIINVDSNVNNNVIQNNTYIKKYNHEDTINLNINQKKNIKHITSVINIDSNVNNNIIQNNTY